MRALKFITGHVIFYLRYNQNYQLKTTHIKLHGTNHIITFAWWFFPFIIHTLLEHPTTMV